MVEDDPPAQSLVLVNAEVKFDSSLHNEVCDSTLEEGRGGEGRGGEGEEGRGGEGKGGERRGGEGRGEEGEEERRGERREGEGRGGEIGRCTKLRWNQ